MTFNCPYVVILQKSTTNIQLIEFRLRYVTLEIGLSSDQLEQMDQIIIKYIIYCYVSQENCALNYYFSRVFVIVLSNIWKFIDNS